MSTTALVRGLTSPLLSLSVLSVLVLPATAQCDVQWRPGGPIAGIGGTVHAAVMHTNGELIVGGGFTAADTVYSPNVARWNGSQWQPLGLGVQGPVYAIVEAANGDVVVGGNFTSAGGAPASRIARWDGAVWTAVGSGPGAPGGSVTALLALPNGDLVVGGQFGTAAPGGPAPNRIAVWNGTAWSSLGTGIPFGTVERIVQLANGDLLVGGNFNEAGGVATRALARWNGTAWSAVPGLDHPSQVFDIEVLPNGAFAVAGFLWIGGTQTTVGVVDATGAQALTPPPGAYRELAVLTNGDLVAGGYFYNPVAQSITGMATRFDGTAWTSFGAGGAPMDTNAFVLAPGGALIAAGIPNGSGVTAYGAVARYDGAAWTALGAARQPKVNAIVRLPDGSVVIGGDFTDFRGVAANHVVRWYAGAFQPLGLGVDAPVNALAVGADGALYVAGWFANAGGGPANRIARWQDGAWSTVAGGLPWVAHEVAAAGAGQVLARNGTLLQYFDGASWSSIVLGSVKSIAAAPEGDFIVGGLFPVGLTNTGALRFAYGVFAQTGAQPLSTIRLGNDRQGRVLASVSGGPQVLRLDGNTWTSLGSMPSPACLTSLPNGDPLIVSPLAAGGVGLFRHDGAQWIAVAGPIVAQAPTNQANALRLACSDAGDMFLGGEVHAIGGVQQTGFAHGDPSCPATATTVGTGCTGAAGPLELAAAARPWLGGTFLAHATGFPTVALAVHALGSVPAAQPLPLGAPGCSLFVVPDIAELLLPAGGAVDVAFEVPRDTALVGLTFRSQVVGLELDAGGALTRLTSTNALALLIGSL